MDNKIQMLNIVKIYATFSYTWHDDQLNRFYSHDNLLSTFRKRIFKRCKAG